MLVFYTKIYLFYNCQSALRIFISPIMKEYMYILRCFDDRLYIGSTIDLPKRIKEHQSGEGANFTKKRLPVQLIYFEEFKRIDEAFKREKQIQRWSRGKKEALVINNSEELHRLARCMNLTHFLNKVN